ncbi:endonuclease domain-containing protein [uncultured Sphingomonas sp.]|uniref:endonuclease domain-containing protein n=1 Tax=uncultured Sphingomonas sp. TaxID=158754 RepID=UPI0025F5B978|nr:endonuclease domain-containing protein [uncultured Sphingomonas sp.]
MLQGVEQVGERARVLRQDMSAPEITLWQVLRKRPGGLKFRRQHLSVPYIADFYCHEARLVIEVDGEAHGYGDRPKRDARRDMWFAERGLTTLRFESTDIQTNIEGMTAQIKATAARRHSGEE